MFAVARSIFWLGVAYMVIRPGVDLPDANALGAQALTASTQMVSSQIQAIPCDSLQCVGGKAVFAAVIQPALPAADPMHETTATRSAPFPQPRPDWRDNGGAPQGA